MTTGRQHISNINFGGVGTGINARDGVADQDLVNVRQLRSEVAAIRDGGAVKDNVMFATTANIDLVSAPATIDGGTPSIGDLSLIHI